MTDIATINPDAFADSLDALLERDRTDNAWQTFTLALPLTLQREPFWLALKNASGEVIGYVQFTCSIQVRGRSIWIASAMRPADSPTPSPLGLP